MNTNRLEELIKEAWLAHSKKNDDEAEQVFRKAITLDPKSVEATFGLAIVLKSQSRFNEALQMFERTLQLINEEAIGNKDRAAMLKRMALGHINLIKTGDWNLEKEIWQR